LSKPRDLIGPYRLARLIRVGSTCAVWEAIKGENERFALKVLRGDLRDNRQEINHLKHEFEVAHKLKHPNVIRVHEFTMDGKTPYLVLELYREQNMKLGLRAGYEKLAFYASKIIEQSAQAMYHLHEHGWVHCDIKPDNILLSEEGDVKLIDFTIAQRIRKGISKLLGGARKIRGTRSYMSPEQIRGQALDARADVYSLGCVAFELLGGKPPFTANTPDELLQKHLTGTIPSIQVLNENVTPEASNLLKRLMAKKPENRPNSMWDFIKELRTVKLFKKNPRLPQEKLMLDPDQFSDIDSLKKTGE
jgi:serine/threonine protein kinase